MPFAYRDFRDLAASIVGRVLMLESQRTRQSEMVDEVESMLKRHFGVEESPRVQRGDGVDF